jgi:hypothetical protein
VLSTATNWATKEKELEFERRKLEYELDLQASTISVRDMEKFRTKAEVLALHVKTVAEYGDFNFDDNLDLVSFSYNGKIRADKELVEAQTAKTLKEVEIADSKLKETNAAVYKIVADT